MHLGKSLRLRRLFANGRALIVPLDHGAEGPIGLVRTLARAGVDGVAVSPGVLERVSDELGALAVILRLSGAQARMQHLVSVQGALELGAEAVLLRVDAHDARDLERLGRVTEEARRLGMPVIADILGEDLLAAVSVAAEYGADAIQTQSMGEGSDLRHIVRTAGRPILVSTGHLASVADLLRLVNQCLEAGVQGVVVEPGPEPVLAAIHGLVHQGISVQEALVMARPAPPAPAE